VRLLGPESAVSHAELDITVARDVDLLIEGRRPDVVFNCAAYNAVDKAESDPTAYRVNAVGPLNVAAACRRAGASFVHYSTNFVFDGTGDGPYVEADQPDPRSQYARSKFDGEVNALGLAGHFLVVRTAAVYGGARGFPHRILETARSGRPLRVVSDQRVNPTFARDLAVVSVRLAEEGIGGIVHAVNEGCCSWDEFARAVLLEAGLDAPVESVPTGAYPAAAARPRNGCLASTRIPPLRPWREALHEALNP
jgi:dTDP-4-dehydrorhamnose reductase